MRITGCAIYYIGLIMDSIYPMPEISTTEAVVQPSELVSGLEQVGKCIGIHVYSGLPFQGMKDVVVNVSETETEITQYQGELLAYIV